MAAIRWGLFAEKAGPLLASWREIQAMKIDPKSPDRDVIGAKVKADKLVPQLEALLYPEDDGDR
jgi:hypothetical protein